MANEKHLYAVFQGGYTDSSNSSEVWQFGVRLILNFGDPDLHGTLPDGWDVTDDSGTSSTTNWDSTFTFGVDAGLLGTFDPMSYTEDYLQPSLEAFMNTNTFSTHTKATHIKLSPIGSNGKVIELRTVVSTANTSLPGAHSGNMMPTESSRAVSFGTPVIGRRGRGRIYLPAGSVSDVAADGYIGSSPVIEAASDTQTFLEGISYTGVGTGDQPHVRPIVTGSPWTKYGIITHGNVGNVFDSQRRRRRQLVEARYDFTPSY